MSLTHVKTLSGYVTLPFTF